MIAIIDYGMGNLRSVEKAFEFLGFDVTVTDKAEIIKKADKIVLPGVGAFCDAIKTVREKKLDEAIYEAVDGGKPFLGICLGMQMIFDRSYENGDYEGLGIIPGKVVRFPDTVKIPHIGWNSLNIKMRSPLFEGLEENPFVYFVHSYHLVTDAPVVSATCDYGSEIQVAVQRENVFALQFHPEKSGRTGLKILQNFGRL